MTAFNPDTHQPITFKAGDRVTIPADSKSYAEGYRTAIVHGIGWRFVFCRREGDAKGAERRFLATKITLVEG